MSVIQTAKESLRTSNRRIVVMGAKGTGKTTFSMSASGCAGNKITGEHRMCSDTLLIQGDSEGVMGAVDVGLEPEYVLDMTHVEDWESYQKLLVDGLKDIKPKIDSGAVKVIVIDLAYPARLIEKKVQPKDPAGWNAVKVEGGKLYRALAGLRGVTVIANCQIKSSAQIIPNATAEQTAEARALGGEISTFTMALTNGIAELWRDNASFVFMRETKRERPQTQDGPTTVRYWTHSQASKKYQAASRAKSVLPARLDGDITLRAILKKVYGDSV